MTREERALKNLKQMCSDGRYLGSGSYAPLEVLEDFAVAIQALEQQSYEDIPTITIPVEDYIKLIEQEPRWISVSEKLPEIQNYSDSYLVTLKRGGVHIAMFTECDGKHWWTYDDVVAWMPLQKPYEP